MNDNQVDEIAEDIDNMIFVDTLSAIINCNWAPELPYVFCRPNENRTSLHIRVSFDDKDEWPGGIFESSDYLKLCYNVKTKHTSLINQTHTMKKFDVSNIHSVDDLRNALLKYYREEYS